MTKTIEVHEIKAHERRFYLSHSVTLGEPIDDEIEAVEPTDQTHEECLFLPVDCLAPGNSPATVFRQLVDAFTSGVVELRIMEAGFDKRMSIRVTYQADGPDPEDADDDDDEGNDDESEE